MAEDRNRRGIVTTVRCESCGGEFSNVTWLPGVPCPRCGSDQLAPVTVVRSSSDFDAADRSQGFALEDVRFGRLAQWADFITPKQFQHALHIQKETARRGGRVPDIAQTMVKQGWLTRRQRDAVLRARSVEPGNREDQDFAQLALNAGKATAEQLEACRAIQEDAAARGRDVPPLPILLYEKRYLREKHVMALLEAAAQRDAGLLAAIRRDAAGEGRKPGDRLARCREYVRQYPQLAVALLVLILVIAFWSYRSVARTEIAEVQCENCFAIGGAPADSEWPIKCPDCGQKAMYPRAVCLECGKEFIVKGVGYGTGCPKCGANNYKMITDRTREELGRLSFEETETPGDEP